LSYAPNSPSDGLRHATWQMRIARAFVAQHSAAMLGKLLPHCSSGQCNRNPSAGKPQKPDLYFPVCVLHNRAQRRYAAKRYFPAPASADRRMASNSTTDALDTTRNNQGSRNRRSLFSCGPENRENLLFLRGNRRIPSGSRRKSLHRFYPRIPWKLGFGQELRCPKWLIPITYPRCRFLILAR